MYGAIIGDIAGSRFEFNNYRKKDFTLFTNRCFFTDDSVMSLAVAEAILSCDGQYDDLSGAAVTCMQQIGRHYPDCGYGGRFDGWVFSNHPQPYNSYGNGSAMRVSAAAWAAATEEECIELSRKVTAVTHSHPEGIRGAEATAVAIFMARQGASKEEILQVIRERYYKLDFTIDGIRSTYRFNETCQETVPQAIEAFAESTDFEDCIRIAVSVGGDSDTLAAIAGSIAEAYYGIPEAMKKQAENYLDQRLKDIADRFEARFGSHVLKD